MRITFEIALIEVVQSCNVTPNFSLVIQWNSIKLKLSFQMYSPV